MLNLRCFIVIASDKDLPLKVGPSPSKKNCFICLNESPFKIYDITAWSRNNYNALIAQYLTKYSQPNNEIWSDIRE